MTEGLEAEVPGGGWVAAGSRLDGGGTSSGAPVGSRAPAVALSARGHPAGLAQLGRGFDVGVGGSPMAPVTVLVVISEGQGSS